jgi:hypothetical protein
MASKPDTKSAENFKSDDSALIRELALLLDETSLTEIEIERAGLRVRVARNITVTASMPASYQQAPSGHAAPAASVTPAAIPEIKQVCRRVDIPNCERVAKRALELEGAPHIKTFLKEELAKVLPDYPV